MKNSWGKYIQLEIATLTFAFIATVFTILQKKPLFAVVAIYFIIMSLLFSALIKRRFMEQIESGKQFGRALILFLLTTYLLFVV